MCYLPRYRIAWIFPDYNKAIELDPTYVMSYVNRGITYGQKGEYDKAIADFNKAIKLDPEGANAYYNRGYAYMKLDKKPEAIADLEKCIELSQNPQTTLKARGLLESLQGQ